jgi:hypothetical protein
VLALINKFVLGMVLLRLLSGSIEILAALLMLKFNQLDKALIINSLLAIVGPITLILTTSLGLFGMAGSISYTRMFYIFAGVGLILFGILKK